MPTATLSRRLGMGWGPQQPDLDDIGNASIVYLGDGLSTPDQPSYNTSTDTTMGTGTFQAVTGIPIYVYLQTMFVGGPNTPTVTFTDGTNTNTLTLIPEASDSTGVDKKKWLFGFIPTFDASAGWFVFSYGGQTQLEQRWFVFKGLGLYTAEGITRTYIGDGATGSDNSANGTSFALSVQAVMNPNNLAVALLWSGDGQSASSPGVGSPIKLRDSVLNAVATTTLSVYYSIGDPSGGRMGMNWTLNISNGGHYIEFRSAASAVPPTSGDFIGTPIHNTSAGASTTYPASGSIAPSQDDLLILVAVHTNTAGLLRTVNAFGGTLTKDGTNPPVWTQAPNSPIDFNTVASPTQRMHVYTAPIDGIPTAGTVIFNLSGGVTGLHLGIYRIPHAAGIGLVATANGSGDAGTAVSTGTLPANPYDAVVMFTGFAGTTAPQYNPGTGYLMRDEGRFAAPNSSLATTWRHNPDTTPDGTLTSALDWAAWSAEVATLSGVNLTVSGAMTLTGQAVTVSVDPLPAAGAMTLTGRSVTVGVSQQPAPGAIAITGQTATLAISPVVSAGALALQGRTVAIGFLIDLGAGAMTLTGGDVTLTIPPPNLGDFASSARSNE